MTTTYLPLQASVVLAHALVAHLGEELGLRVLFLKGPIATIQGLREPDYVSGDVDALCETGQEQRLTNALAARGWRERMESEAHALFVTHSVTLSHPQWPCDIDVHTSFPGFLASSDRVFDALWAQRQTFELADVAVAGPDYPTQCLIVLLHGLRAPYLPKNASEIEVSRARFTEMSLADQEALVRLVKLTGASEVVHDFFNELGVEINVPASSSAEYLAWRLITQPSRTEGWTLAISQARGIERWKLLYRAIIPTKEDLILDHPAAAMSNGAAARAYLTRLTRAARLAPGAVGNVVRARSARTHLSTEPVDDLPAVTDHAASDADRTLAAVAPTPADATSDVDDRTGPAQTGPALAVYAAEPDGSGVPSVFVLPLQSERVQAPVKVNTVGHELLALLLESGGNLGSAVRDAAELFEKPADEIRPMIEDFRHEMVRLGVLQA